MKRIYTRRGDEGTTSLHGGRRVSKTDTRIKANGSIDHLNATLGVIRALADRENNMPHDFSTLIDDIQHDLMNIMSIIAAMPGDTSRSLSHERVNHIEEYIDAVSSEVPMPAGFVIPGSELISAFLHLARTDARASEISLWALDEEYTVDRVVLRYFNRLSDLLFVLAISLSGKNEIWKPSSR